LRSISLSGATDPDNDPVKLTISTVTQDEPLNGRADGNTSPDAVLGPGGDRLRLRAERSGRGDGRVYRIAFTATDPSGASCSGTVAVTVPHDRRGASAVNSGSTFNSLGPSQHAAKGHAKRAEHDRKAAQPRLPQTGAYGPASHAGHGALSGKKSGH
jgi:hypothetical protein